jgi:hypothetical protein
VVLNRNENKPYIFYEMLYTFNIDHLHFFITILYNGKYSILSKNNNKIKNNLKHFSGKDANKWFTK